MTSAFTDSAVWHRETPVVFNKHCRQIATTRLRPTNLPVGPRRLT